MNDIPWFFDVSTAATVYPFETEEAKRHLRVDTADDDKDIKSMIESATERAEQLTERQFLNATWKLYLDRFPSWTIEIRKPPVSSVSSITYVDVNGTTQTLASTEYTTDLTSEPARITPAYGKEWPSTRKQVNAVTVTFVAGYGSAATDLPEKFKRLVKLLLQQEYWGAWDDMGLQRAIDQLIEQCRWSPAL